MIETLVSLLLLAVLIYVAYLVIGMLALPPQVKTIVNIIVAIIVLLVILRMFGIYDAGTLRLKNP